MTEFRRIISYIHLYENMQRGKNIGFIKTDVQSGKCRIEVRINGVYTNGRENCEIYSLLRNGNTAKGYYVGAFPMAQQSGQYHLQCEDNQFDDHGNRIDEIAGFAFRLSEDRLALSLFSGKEPCFEEVCIARKKYGKNGVHDEERETTERQSEIADQQPKTVEEHPQMVKRQPETIELIQMTEEQPETHEKEITKEQTDEKAENVSVMTPFEDVQGYVFYKVTPEQLKNLASEYAIMQHNSFLLHGFYNYRYLIMGQKEADRWILGVPGVYHEREQMMASMFGFPEFKSAARGNRKPGTFGYYLKEVRVDSSSWKLNPHPVEIQNSYT